MIDEMMPWPHKVDGRIESGGVDLSTWNTPLASDTSGYIRFVDTSQLVALSKAYHVKVHVVRRVGHFVPEGAPLLTVYKGERLSPEKRAELRSALDLGPARTLQQDVEFGVLQIVDIALKAISPAVNIPARVLRASTS